MPEGLRGLGSTKIKEWLGLGFGKIFPEASFKNWENIPIPAKYFLKIF